MWNALIKVLGDKKDWRAMQARARALPREYRIVYAELTSHLWRFTAGDGRDVVAVLQDVLARFEAGAARGTQVLDVKGPDVAAFCDERLRGIPSYADRWRASLNRGVAAKLAH